MPARRVGLAALGTCFTLAVQATPVVPDLTYGELGVAHVHAGPADEIAHATALQPDGKLVVVGSCEFAVCVVRLHADGTPDASFNASGRVLLKEASTYSNALLNVRIQPDGKIVVGGSCGTFCVARLNADGSRDTSFNGNGFATAASPRGAVAEAVVTLQSNGRIAVLGQCGAEKRFCATRFGANGIVDSSFGNAGIVDEPTHAGALAAVPLSDDRILVLAGCGENPVCLRRLLENGLPDPSFNAAALPMQGSEPRWGIERSMTVLADGKIALAGRCDAVGACLARLNDDGSFDTSFNGTGYVGVSELLTAMAAQPDGKVVAASLCLNGQFLHSACVARWNANGTPDAAFNAGAPVQPGMSIFAGANMPLVLLANNKVVVASSCMSHPTQLNQRDVCAARIAGDGAIDASFGINGVANPILVLRSGGLPERAVLQPDGKLLIAGNCPAVAGFEIGDYGDACLARLTPAGEPDPSFSGLGAVQIDLGGMNQHSVPLVQADGGIVIASSCESSGEVPKLCLGRLHANGELDVAFGEKGRTAVPAGPTPDVHVRVAGMAAQSDGKLVVGGWCFKASASYACAYRFHADGSVDAGFNGSTAIHAIQFGTDGGQAHFALQADGKALIASSCGGDFCVVRFNTDGSPDLTFGVGGRVTTSLTTGADVPSAMLLLDGGKIVLAGTCVPLPGFENMCKARYLLNGALDPQFGQDGLVVGASGALDAIALEPGGKLVAAARCGSAPCVLRFHENGLLDTSFNDANALFTSFLANGVLLQQDGKILLVGGGGGGFAAIRFAGEPGVTLTAVRSDLNGDGRSDILWHHGVTGAVYGLQMNGFTASTIGLIDQETDLNWKIAAVADLNADGRADIVWRHDTTGQVYGLLMNGLTASGEGTIYTEPNTQWKIVGAGDFDGDGREDLLWRNGTTGDVFLLLMNGLTVGGGGVIYSEPNANWQIQKVADFNGDGRADVLWRNAATGDVFALLMNGTEVIGGGVIYSEPNAAWQIQAAADFNGDGRADVLWRNTATGDVFLMLMNGTTITGGSVFYSEPNTDWQIVAIGDYNGNGRADILWRNNATGQAFMMLMDGFTISSGGFVYTEPDLNWKILGP